MQYSISIYVEGDEEITLEQVVALADAVAKHNGIASGAGAMGYGVQIAVEAEDELQARQKAIELFNSAVIESDLPVWPIVEIESVSENEALEELE